MTINSEQIKALLDHFDNNIVVSDDENELVLFKLKERGFVGRQTFCIQFNGKVIKDAKRIPTILKHFNEMINKYNLHDGLVLLKSEYKIECGKIEMN